MNLIGGKELAQKILSRLADEVITLPDTLKLAIIQVGQNQASNLYVEKKLSDARKIGITTELKFFDSASFQEIQELITDFNSRKDITGFFIQLPFPVKGEIYKLFNLISELKDVDGLNAINLGKIWQGDETAFYPATVLAVIECLRYVASNLPVSSDLDKYLEGKNILIVNHSVIVGKPLAGYLIGKNATVTVAHRYTEDLKKYMYESDIIISATGKMDLIVGDFVKDDTVLIDVGITKTENGVFGDMNMQTMQHKNVWLTPVPDGVGPLTRVMLLENVIKAYKLQQDFG